MKQLEPGFNGCLQCESTRLVPENDPYLKDDLGFTVVMQQFTCLDCGKTRQDVYVIGDFQYSIEDK